MNFLSIEPQHASCLPSGKLSGIGDFQASYKRSNDDPSQGQYASGSSGFVSIDIIDIT
jgi:hypothetical protein